MTCQAIRDYFLPNTTNDIIIVEKDPYEAANRWQRITTVSGLFLVISVVALIILCFTFQPLNLAVFTSTTGLAAFLPPISVAFVSLVVFGAAFYYNQVELDATDNAEANRFNYQIEFNPQGAPGHRLHAHWQRAPYPPPPPSNKTLAITSPQPKSPAVKITKPIVSKPKLPDYLGSYSKDPRPNCFVSRDRGQSQVDHQENSEIIVL